MFLFEYFRGERRQRLKKGIVLLSFRTKVVPSSSKKDPSRFVLARYLAGILEFGWPKIIDT